MGKKNFDRKKAVRFSLVPGPFVDGKPTVLYKPVQTRKSKVTKKQRKQVISKLADVEEITINGKVVEEDEIPAYVLQQIRGRGDLIYNQMKGMPKEEEVGDMYEIQDAKEGDEEYEQYEIEEYDEEQKPIIHQQQHDYSQNQDQWQDEDGEWSEGQMEQEEIEDDPTQKKNEKYETKVEQFPTIQQTKIVKIEGKEYQLTTKQIEMLDIVIPQNYEEMDFGGIQFKKYNEDGLPLSEKEKYQKYLLGENEKVVVVDSYEYVPPRPIDTYDTDLSPAEINKDVNLKEIQEALNYVGDEAIYEELEDDFFAKMIQMELGETQQNKPKTTQKAEKQTTQSNIVSKPKEKKETAKEAVKKDIPQISEKQLEQQLKKAVFDFEHNIQEKKQKPMNESSDQDEQEESYSHTNHSMNFTDLEKRQQYKGPDGELDWRCLTKKEKKQYMKTKVIQDFYDELRNREIEQKMQGKTNVKVEQLHLKTLIKHIPYQEDLVMQKALEEDLKKEVHLSDEDEDAYESLSEQDDIISFHQKTSIIASNLSIIEEPKNKKPKKQKQEEQHPEQHNLTKIKVVPERRNKDQTPEQRKERKNKLKQMKNQRKEQKKQFAERFNKIKKQTHRSQNTTNPLNKVSYVKIY